MNSLIPMSRIPIGAVIAIAALAAALTAGCGKEQLDAGELLSRGDALCRAEQEQFTKVQVDPPGIAQDAVGQTEQLIEASNDALEGLKDLGAPDELEDAYGDYLDAKEEGIELLEDGRDAADRQDSSDYAKAQTELADGAAKRRKLAGAVGFKVCSSSAAT